MTGSSATPKLSTAPAIRGSTVGISTEVNGNCGFSAAPVHPPSVALVRKYVEGFIAPEQGVPWDWQSLGDYLDSIAHAQLAINLVPLLRTPTGTPPVCFILF